jgi:hypothetical protein
MIEAKILFCSGFGMPFGRTPDITENAGVRER